MKNMIIILASCLSVSSFAENNYGVGFDQDSGIRSFANIGSHQVGMSGIIEKRDAETFLDQDVSNYDIDTVKLGLFYRLYHVKDEKLNHFIESTYIYTQNRRRHSFQEQENNLDDRQNEIGFYYGLEYMLTPRFSFSGKIGITYEKTDMSGNDGEIDDYTFFDPSFSARYYW